MQKLVEFFRLSAYGTIISFLMLITIFITKNYMPYELFLREALPFYKTDFKFLFTTKNYNLPNENENDFNNNCEVFNEIEPSDLINDIEYKKVTKPIFDSDQLCDLTFLKSKFYSVDKKTDLTLNDFDVKKFLAANTSIDNSTDKVKVLIFHTHSTEMYKDSDNNNMYDGVVGLGAKLSQILNDKYKIKTLHHTKRYDIVNSKPDKRGAYERMETDVMKIIKANPSIEVAIDIHRDGVAENIHLVENINGKPTAKIMFVDGLCKLFRNNILTPLNNLPNPYLDTNLALSFKMQLKCYELYPNLARKIYINAYRYSLNMLPKSLLVEIGAQTNTKQEALNAIEPLADVLAKVLLEQ